MADLLKRLREPPFGTETSERRVMAEAADEIERQRKALFEIMNMKAAAMKDRARVCKLSAEIERMKDAARKASAMCEAGYPISAYNLAAEILGDGTKEPKA